VQFDHLRRREFITLLGSAAAAWPRTVRAQQQKTSVVGILSPAPSEATPLFDAFRGTLKDLGWVEGSSVRLDFRLARGKPDAIPALAAELVKTSPDVIVSDGGLVAHTLKSLTTTIPIVAVLGADPVATGLVASLAKPGGNITGVTILGTDLHAKRIELLKEAIPQLSRLAVLWDRGIDPRGLIIEAMLDYARRAGLRLDVVEGGRAAGLAAALAPDRLKDAGAVLVSAGPTHFNNRYEIVQRIAASVKPASYAQRDYVTAGGLMSYGADVADVFRRLAKHVDRILKGAMPSDIPVEQVTRIHYALNLKTAKALGLEIPPMLLARADEVIE
jgi:putative tryptophan/tyrosine transport system substrate-binding protein